MNGAKSLTNPAAVPSERGAGFKRYKASLKYGFYVIFHPFDGFWDLVHEQRGSLLAAHTWLFLFLANATAGFFSTSGIMVIFLLTAAGMCLIALLAKKRTIRQRLTFVLLGALSCVPGVILVGMAVTLK